MTVEARPAVIDRPAVVGVGGAIVARAVVAVARPIGIARPGRGGETGADRAGGEPDPDAWTPAPATCFGLGRRGDTCSAQRSNGRKSDCGFLHGLVPPGIPLHAATTRRIFDGFPGTCANCAACENFILMNGDEQNAVIPGCGLLGAGSESITLVMDSGLAPEGGAPRNDGLIRAFQPAHGEFDV